MKPLVSQHPHITAHRKDMTMHHSGVMCICQSPSSLGPPALDVSMLCGQLRDTEFEGNEIEADKPSSPIR